MIKVLTRKMPSSNDEISILGYGCMRFQRKLGAIDMAQTEKQLLLALDYGVNYFDTAAIYPGSERVVGEILSKSDEKGKIRDRVFLATKMHLMFAKTRGDMERIFSASLEKLKTDYIDYFLVHSLASFSEWEKGKNNGLIDFLNELRISKKVRHIGFSWHGNLHDFKEMVDDYDWDFCQLQFNYIDENHQAGLEGLNYAAEKNLGIIVMEPLRGGLLADKSQIPPGALKIFDDFSKNSNEPSNKTPAEWALRWIWNHPAVTCVLSGMNEEFQIEENVRIASGATANSLNSDELVMIDKVKNIFHNSIKVNCTGCSYCMPCPAGVNIPLCFSDYNNYAMFKSARTKFIHNFYLRGRGKKPAAIASNCKKCGICEKKCPQGIEIIKSLEEVATTIEGPLYKGIAKLASSFMG